MHRGAEGEQVKVLDFGIASLRSRDDRTLTRLTIAESPLGTALYTAPERLRDNRCDGRADVYSVAVMLYIMLSGQVPFEMETDSPIEIMYCQLNEEPTLLSEHRADIPVGIQELVMRGMRKDPEQRPTARQFLSELKALAAPLALSDESLTRPG